MPDVFFLPGTPVLLQLQVSRRPILSSRMDLLI